ncbi:MAG: delta-aminolevulinic acid dehydratase, partial [Sphingobacteriales bacterium]
MVQQSFDKLRTYCEAEDFKGWDPYDGLNSKLFRALPFIANKRLPRLAWIQLFKRSPLNLRRLARVPKDYNPKGLGLFLAGYCNLYQAEPRDEYKNKIVYLADKLLELRSDGYSGSCWGYNFDWQARAFFQPRYT